MIYVIGFPIAVDINYGHALVDFPHSLGAIFAPVPPIPSRRTLGINVKRVRMVTFALGAACAGVGGTLIGEAFHRTIQRRRYLLNRLAIIVLGGLGNVLGTFFGGLVLGFVQSLGGLTWATAIVISSAWRCSARVGVPAGRFSGAEAIVKALSGIAEVGVILAAFVLLWFASEFIGRYGLQIAIRVLIYLTLAES